MIDNLVLRQIGIAFLLEQLGNADDLNRYDLKTGMTVGSRIVAELPLAGQPVPVGTVSYRKGSSGSDVARVVDEAALLAHVKATRPDGVVESVAPWLVRELQAAALKSGEVIPGIELGTTNGSKPTIEVKLEKDSVEARAAILSAIFADGTQGLRSLLALEPPASTE